jgi:hypothetical protein
VRALALPRDDGVHLAWRRGPAGPSEVGASAGPGRGGGALQLVGRPVENADPGDLLLTEIVHVAGTVASLRTLIGDLDPDDVVAGSARPFYDVYVEAQAQLMKYAELAARLGLEQRRTALAEALSGLVFGLIRNVLAAASLTQDQHAAAMAALPPALAELRAQLEPPGRTT